MCVHLYLVNILLKQFAVKNQDMSTLPSAAGRWNEVMSTSCALGSGDMKVKATSGPMFQCSDHRGTHISWVGRYGPCE
jgi:hypothetical protein